MGPARIAFVGAVLRDTPTVVTPSGVAGLRFEDEVSAINRVIPQIRRGNVESRSFQVAIGLPAAVPSTIVTVSRTNGCRIATRASLVTSLALETWPADPPRDPKAWLV